MASSDVDVNFLLETALQRTLRNIRSEPVAQLAEARCAWRLMSELKDFVFAEEGAPFDAGVIVYDGLSLTHSENPTERLIDALELFKDKNVIIPLDFKTIVPHALPWWAGLLYGYGVGLSDAQRGCGLVIVVNPGAPHLVAAVLPEFFNRKWREVPYQDPEVEPFPMEISPFVMPIAFLAQAVQEAVKFYRDPQGGYRNPYSGIVVTKCAAPELAPVECLLPSPNNPLTDWREFKCIWRAFRQYATRFRVERTMVSGGVTGDFLVVHIGSGATASVEMKRGGMFQFIAPDKVKHTLSSRRMQAPLFSPLSSWDYLLSISGGRALFVSRDQLPLAWFTEQPKGDHHDYQASQKFVKQHVLDWSPTSMQKFVVGMERVLEEHLEDVRELRATRRIPFVSPTRAEVEKYWSRIDADKLAEPLVKDSHPDRGSKRYGSKQQFRGRQEQLLKRQCLQTSFGALSRNGYHPSAWFNLALGVFDHARPVFFADLHPDTSFFFVNFAEVNGLDLVEPRDVSKPVHLFPATHGKSPSMYVLVPHPQDLEGRGLNWCVVSSLQFRDDKRRHEYNKNVLTLGWRGGPSTERKSLPILLDSRESTQWYQVGEHEVMDLFERLFRKWAAGEGAVSLGSDIKVPHDSIDLSLHVVSKREIMEQFVEQAFGDSVWAHRIKSSVAIGGESDADDD